MPIFEYKCESCGTKFEKLLRNASHRDGLICPTCGQQELTQEYSTFAARANGPQGTQGRGEAQSEMTSCPGGMCGNPGLCGRN